MKIPLETNPVIIIETGLGNIKAELYPLIAPVTVANFLANIVAGIYCNSSFHRAAYANHKCTIYNDVIGISVIEASKAPNISGGPPIIHEGPNITGLFNLEGVLAMSRDEPGSAASDFFINLSDNTDLDNFGSAIDPNSKAGFATFGRVLQGMEVVHAIHQQPAGQYQRSTDEQEKHNQVSLSDPELADWIALQELNTPVIIRRISVE